MLVKRSPEQRHQPKTDRQEQDRPEGLRGIVIFQVNKSHQAHLDFSSFENR